MVYLIKRERKKKKIPNKGWINNKIQHANEASKIIYNNKAIISDELWLLIRYLIVEYNYHNYVTRATYNYIFRSFHHDGERFWLIAYNNLLDEKKIIIIDRQRQKKTGKILENYRKLYVTSYWMSNQHKLSDRFALICEKAFDNKKRMIFRPKCSLALYKSFTSAFLCV